MLPNHTVFEWNTFMGSFHGCCHGRYTDMLPNHTVFEWDTFMG